MAENKKGFILYCDTINVVRKLREEDERNKTNHTGALLLIILEYVNDLQLTPVDLVVEVAFESIKQQLKRDLKKYEAKQKQRSEAGKTSAEVRRRQRESTTVQRESTTDVNRSTNSTVIDTVIDIDKDTVLSKDNESLSPIEFYEIHVCYEMALNIESLIESLCMLHKLTIDDIKAKLTLFVLKLKADGIERKTFTDFTSHFNNWLRIELKNSTNDEQPTKKKRECVQ